MIDRRSVLILLTVSVLMRPACISAADCVTECMQRSGCWSGRSVSDPHGCSNMPELCAIQCRGQQNNSWGAIAYSKQDQAAGWSYEKSDKATAERIAMQECVKQGGVRCVVEASFSNACGAVAADGALVAWGTADTKVNAQQRALTECAKSGGKKCAVQASLCSIPNASTVPPSSPRPPKQISWGAIAYSSADYGAGWSQGKGDRATAEREAMSICAQRGKACVIETSFNKACGALAADRNFTGSGTSADPREANQKAIDACRKAGGARCALHISFCSN